MPEKTDKIKAASGQTLRDFLARNSYGILVVDHPGIIRFANQAAATILGCSIENLLGEQCGFPLVTDTTTELTVKSRDGRTVTLEMQGMSTEWNGSPATVVHLHDITERRQKDMELRKIYRAVLEIPSIVMITDSSGTIEFVNPRFTAVTGYTFAEAVGRNPRFLNSGKTPPEMYREMWETIKAGTEWRGEMINRKKNGDLYYESAAISPIMDMEGKITSFIAVAEDITERKRMEAALRESEDKFSKAFQAVPALLSISSLADGRYIEVNEAFEKSLGYRRDEVIGRPAPQLGIWENPDDRNQLVRFIRERDKVRDFVVRLRGKEGGVIVGALSAEIINIKGEECLLALTRDITRIKQAEERLRKSEQLLAEAQRLAHLGSWEWNIGADKLTPSTELLLIFGVSPEELDPTYAGILNMVHPDDREHYEREIRTAIAAKTSYDNYHRIIRPDGTIRILHSQGTVTVDETDTPVSLIGTCQDVTERRQAEETLRETEQKLRNVVEHSTNLFYMHTTDHILTYVSPQSRQFFDCEPEEAMVKWTELITDNPLNLAAIEATQRAIDTGEPQPPYQVECIGMKGRKIWVEVNEAPLVENGRTVAIVGSLTDITVRKRAEEAVRKSEKKFLTVFHAVPALLGITTVAEGRFIDVNETCARILGYQREEVIGRTTLELGIWESQADRDRVIRALQEHGTVRDIEISLRGKTGESFVGLMSAEFIDIEGEQYVLSMINDITDRKLAEEKIEVLNTDLMARAIELEAANRELEAFSYTVSHDLRKPLTVINGYSQMILDMCGRFLDEQCTRFLKEIGDGTLRMNQLIDSLLEFSRLTHCELRLEAVDLCGMARALAAELSLAEPERQVTFRIGVGITVKADAGLLRVVLTNLLGNAWKYTAGKGEAAVIEIGATEVAGEPACLVRDNGQGFDMAHADKLFVPFQRLPGAGEFQGHGIGLATAHRIIQRHGGRMWAEGAPGKGATFYFTLPEAKHGPTDIT